MRIVNLQQGSQEWLQERLTKITGTDMAMVCREESWPRLRQSKINPNTYRSPAMIRGNLFEDEARSALQDKTGILYQPVVMVDDDMGALVSLDGLAALRVATCEIKIPEKGTESDLWTKAACGKIPKQYRLQMQAGMMLSGAPVCHYWVYDVDSQQGILLVVKSDEAIQNEIRESITAYWRWLSTQDHSNPVNAINARTGEIASKAEEDYIELLYKKKLIEDQIAKYEAEFTARRKVGAEVTKGVLINVTETEKQGAVDWKKIVETNMPTIDTESYRKPAPALSVKVELNGSGKSLLQAKIQEKKAGSNAVQKNGKAA